MGRFRGLRDFVFDAIEDTNRLVEKTHASVAERSVRRYVPIEPLSTPARAVNEVHMATASAVYATLRLVNRAVQKATDAGTEVLGLDQLLDDGALLPETPQRADAAGSVSWLVDHAQSALNGFAGDRLSQRGNGLDLGMTLRHHGRVVPVERATLETVLPNRTGKLCFFVHGLSCTEWAWSIMADRYYGDPTVNFGTLLRTDLGYTPLYIRYNTGRHVSDNGRLLSSLIAEVVAQYPGEVTEIALIGHSMGGLVSRSAAHYAHADGEAWVEHLRHVFCLASPHLGAPLEKATHALSSVLRFFEAAGAQVPADLLDARSAGVRDLRHGFVTEEERRAYESGGWAEDTRQHTPFLEGVGYYYLAATITRDPMHPLGQILGDLLVQLPSASGFHPDASRRIPFRSGKLFSGLNHFDLANHPDVYAAIRACIEDAGRAKELLEAAVPPDSPP